MKRILCVLTLSLLGACAAPGGGGETSQRTQNDLRKPMYLRTEQLIPLTFPQIQMALIKHRRLCGYAPKFSVVEGQTAYGSIVDRSDTADGWDKAILIDLTWLQPTWRQETRVRAEVFSVYGGRDVDERIRLAFAAISQPEICPGAEAANPS